MGRSVVELDELVATEQTVERPFRKVSIDKQAKVETLVACPVGANFRIARLPRYRHVQKIG